MNIDTLLVTIINHHFDQLSETISSRDLRVLTSLSRSITNIHYITEKQSKLLLKIVNDNLENFKVFESDIDVYVNTPLWSKPFRLIDQTKIMFISYDNEPPTIRIEFTFSSQLKKVMSDLTPKVSGLCQYLGNSTYIAELTEKNIVLLVDELSKHNFKIDIKIKDFYDIITSWKYKDYQSQFLITTIQYPNFQEQLTSDLGIDTPLTQNILNDRSNRYQYVANKNKSPVSLTEIIANRATNRIWIDRSIFSLDQIINSLVELKRLPLLVVFDNTDAKHSTNELKLLSTALDSNNINSNIGIYFRVSNENGKSEFNQLIADKRYNGQLDNTTQVVGVQNGKIPKFFLTTNWKPMSVISIGCSLKHNKTSVYANCCDLNIAYTDKEPIIETRNLWE